MLAGEVFHHIERLEIERTDNHIGLSEPRVDNRGIGFLHIVIDIVDFQIEIHAAAAHHRIGGNHETFVEMKERERLGVERFVRRLSLKKSLVDLFEVQRHHQRHATSVLSPDFRRSQDYQAYRNI